MLSSTLLLVALAATPATGCTPRAEPWVAFELQASEPAGDEPAQLVDIDAAGCATLRYASFDRRAGLYRRQLDATEIAALRGEIAQGALLRFDTDAVQREVEQAERQRAALLAGDAPTRHAIVCGDTYRLTLDQGGARASIQWYAPKQDAARHPQVQALGELVRVIDTLQTIAAADGKVRIAQVTP